MSEDPVEGAATPEAEGIPDYADDDSTAYDDTARPSFRDSPPAMPADEPQALDTPGLTAEEQRQGEPLDEKLARESPQHPHRRDAERGRLGTGDGRSAEEEAMHETSGDELGSQS